MIEFVKAFKTEDGKTHASIEEAQKHSLSVLLENVSAEETSSFLVRNRDKVVDILTTKKSSKPRARSINGGRKNRTAKSGVTQERPEAA